MLSHISNRVSSLPSVSSDSCVRELVESEWAFVFGGEGNGGGGSVTVECVPN